MLHVTCNNTAHAIPNCVPFHHYNVKHVHAGSAVLFPVTIVIPLAALCDTLGPSLLTMIARVWNIRPSLITASPSGVRCHGGSCRTFLPIGLHLHIPLNH